MKLVRKEFINWLHSKEDFEVVGVSGNPYACPLKRFIWETTHTHYIYVTNASVRYVGRNGYYYAKALPSWASKFVNAIDANRYKYEEITVEEALEVLEDV